MYSCEFRSVRVNSHQVYYRAMTIQSGRPIWYLRWYHRTIFVQYPEIHLFQPWQQNTAVSEQQKELVHEVHPHLSPLQFWNQGEKKSELQGSILLFNMDLKVSFIRILPFPYRSIFFILAHRFVYISKKKAVCVFQNLTPI